MTRMAADVFRFFRALDVVFKQAVLALGAEDASDGLVDPLFGELLRSGRPPADLPTVFHQIRKGAVGTGQTRQSPPCRL